MKKDLGNGFRVEPISKTDYDDFRQTHEPHIFPNRYDINAQGALSPAEREALQALGERLGDPFSLRLGLFAGDRLVGWNFGQQISLDTYRMVTTGVLPEFQRKGIYSALLAALADHILAKDFRSCSAVTTPRIIR